MDYGSVERVTTHDSGGSQIEVTVKFLVDRRVIYEFMDCLEPVVPGALREPIRAIMDHSPIGVEPFQGVDEQ